MGQVLRVVSGPLEHVPIYKGLLCLLSGQVAGVDGVSFSLKRGETLGLVGESGCGKSTVGRTLLRLLEPTDGTVRIGGEDITHLDAEHLLPYRRRMQMIYQDPYASLNPRMTAGEIVGEPLIIHNIRTPAEHRPPVAPRFGPAGPRPPTGAACPAPRSWCSRAATGLAASWARWTTPRSRAVTPR